MKRTDPNQCTTIEEEAEDELMDELLARIYLLLLSDDNESKEDVEA